MCKEAKLHMAALHNGETPELVHPVPYHTGAGVGAWQVVPVPEYCMPCESRLVTSAHSPMTRHPMAMPTIEGTTLTIGNITYNKHPHLPAASRKSRYSRGLPSSHVSSTTSLSPVTPRPSAQLSVLPL